MQEKATNFSKVLVSLLHVAVKAAASCLLECSSIITAFLMFTLVMSYCFATFKRRFRCRRYRLNIQYNICQLGTSTSNKVKCHPKVAGPHVKMHQELECNS